MYGLPRAVRPRGDALRRTLQPLQKLFKTGSHIDAMKRLAALPQVRRVVSRPLERHELPRSGWQNRAMADARGRRRAAGRPTRLRSPSPRWRAGSASPRRRCARGTAATGSVRPSTPRARTGGTPPPTSSGCSSCGGSRSTASRPPSRPGSRSRPTSPTPADGRARGGARPRPPSSTRRWPATSTAARACSRSRRTPTSLAWWTGLVEPALDGAGPTHRRRPARASTRPRRCTPPRSRRCATGPRRSRAPVGRSSSCSSRPREPRPLVAHAVAGALASHGVDARIVGGPGGVAPRVRARRDDAGRGPWSRSARERTWTSRWSSGSPSEHADLPQFVMVPDRAVGGRARSAGRCTGRGPSPASCTRSWPSRPPVDSSRRRTACRHRTADQPFHPLDACIRVRHSALATHRRTIARPCGRSVASETNVTRPGDR